MGLSFEQLEARRAERERRRLETVHAAFRTVLDTGPGQTALWHVVDTLCNTFGGQLVLGRLDAQRATDVNLGRREVGRELMALCAALSPQQTADMLRTHYAATLKEQSLRAAEAVPSAGDASST